eukprot:jgi/Phyca11/17640/fgenesh1_pg.PHYCAscaffold_29_\
MASGARPSVTASEDTSTREKKRKRPSGAVSPLPIYNHAALEAYRAEKIARVRIDQQETWPVVSAWPEYQLPRCAMEMVKEQLHGKASRQIRSSTSLHVQGGKGDDSSNQITVEEPEEDKKQRMSTTWLRYKISEQSSLNDAQRAYAVLDSFTEQDDGNMAQVCSASWFTTFLERSWKLRVVYQRLNFILTHLLSTLPYRRFENNAYVVPNVVHIK